MRHKVLGSYGSRQEAIKRAFPYNSDDTKILMAPINLAYLAGIEELSTIDVLGVTFAQPEHYLALRLYEDKRVAFRVDDPDGGEPSSAFFVTREIKRFFTRLVDGEIEPFILLWVPRHLQWHSSSVGNRLTELKPFLVSFEHFEKMAEAFATSCNKLLAALEPKMGVRKVDSEWRKQAFTAGAQVLLLSEQLRELVEYGYLQVDRRDQDLSYYTNLHKLSVKDLCLELLRARVSVQTAIVPLAEKNLPPIIDRLQIERLLVRELKAYLAI
jgi:hypothetical protein